MVDLLLVGREQGYEVLQEAIEKTLAMGCSDVSAVLLLLNTGKARQRGVPEPVEIGSLSRYDRPQPTMIDYDQLLQKWPEIGVIQ
jgi:sirohydrochlorin ferrochelatase